MPAIIELGSSCAAEFTVSLAPMTSVRSVSVGQTFVQVKICELNSQQFFHLMLLGSPNTTLLPLCLKQNHVSDFMPGC